jgi:hypothetical protein
MRDICVDGNEIVGIPDDPRARLVAVDDAGDVHQVPPLR